MSTVSPENLIKLKEILHQLDEHLGEKNTQENRRSATRITVHMPITMQLLTGISPCPVEAFTRNISASGLGFVSKRMFRRYECVSLTLHFPRMPGKLVLARITFSRYLRNGLYEMGAEFLEAISNVRGTARIPDHWTITANAGKVHISPAGN